MHMIAKGQMKFARAAHPSAADKFYDLAISSTLHIDLARRLILTATKPSRLSKAGPAKVRATLYMAAVVAKRYNPHIKALCERLTARGKPTMSVLGAAMRKLVHLCFGVLKTRQPYQANYLASA